MTKCNDLYWPHLFVVGIAMVFIGIITVAAIGVLGYTQHGHPQPTLGILGINETKTITYSQWWGKYVGNPYYGGVVMSISDLGTYRIVVTTENPRDRVSVHRWDTYQFFVNDKFGGRFEPLETGNPMFGRGEICTSNSRSDCDTTFVVEDGGWTGTRIWLGGDGSGKISLTRLK